MRPLSSGTGPSVAPMAIPMDFTVAPYDSEPPDTVQQLVPEAMVVQVEDDNAQLQTVMEWTLASSRS